MTRFEADLNGVFGEYWKRDAENKMKDVKEEIEVGRISIDENGIARNCIGRVIMSDLLEVVAKVSDKVDVAATMAARKEEVEKSIKEYKEQRKGCSYSEEELAELRAIHGPGAKIVDCITGESIIL